MSARTFNALKHGRYGSVRVNKDSQGHFITLHGHQIVEVMPYGAIRLSACGWRTNTTKTAINNALGQLGSPWRLYQRRFAWYITNGEDTFPFEDNDIWWSNEEAVI